MLAWRGVPWSFLILKGNYTAVLINFCFSSSVCKLNLEIRFFSTGEFFCSHGLWLYSHIQNKQLELICCMAPPTDFHRPIESFEPSVAATLVSMTLLLITGCTTTGELPSHHNLDSSQRGGAVVSLAVLVFWSLSCQVTVTTQSEYLHKASLTWIDDIAGQFSDGFQCPPPTWKEIFLFG